MSFRVETTARAERDFWNCHDYIQERSLEGAGRWVVAFNDALLSLEDRPTQSRAPEQIADGLTEEIRQKVFKTKHGLRYRLLFVVRGDTVHVIHVRGPGQDVLRAEELELPDE
ncbi:MAG: hypothetical protein IID44_14475 [Planctomycetes bacterium]|nr:hypothetical protein [Planctomycetota bacterium]